MPNSGGLCNLPEIVIFDMSEQEAEEREKPRRQRVTETPAAANGGEDRRRESIVGKKKKCVNWLFDCFHFGRKGGGGVRWGV